MMCRGDSTLTTVSVVLVSVTLLTRAVDGSVEQKTRVKSDVCEYDIDLKKNTFHAKCRGQPLGVSVFANSASVSAGQVQGQFPPVGHVSGGAGHAGFQPPFLAVEMDNKTLVQLKTMKDKLTSQRTAISNISHLLSRGDNDLRSDLEALRGLAPGDSAVRESIIATMRNQYNFMRTAILAHNAELNQVLDLLGTLVTMTTDTRRQALSTQRNLQQQLLTVNRTMLAMRTTFSPCLRKCHRRTEKRRRSQCPRTVSAIGSGDVLPAMYENGVVMTDSAAENSGKIWVMNADEGRDQLKEYTYRQDLRFNVVGRTISLPFFCEGTGHLVFRNSLFCHKASSRTVTKYSLKRLEVSAEVELPTAGVANTFPYQFRMYSDIDLAVDEQGLWVIYSTKESAGKIVISKLNPRSLAIEKTWLTSFPKKMAGNAFMICGVLYATNSYQDTPTFIRYIYDTSTQQEAKMEPGNLVFNNAVNVNASKQASSVMLQYSPSEQVLYSWSRKEILTFPVYFKKDKKD